MSLNGIDIASWQAGLVISKMTTTDFVVVKATEDTDYVNPYFAKWAADAVKQKKKLGCYHFATIGDAVKQADYFLGAVKKYYGKAIMFLDWEASAVSQGPAWAKTFLDRVYKKTGQKGMIYMSKSVCNAYNWSSLVKAGYGLWVAQYPDNNATGYKKNPWTDGSKFGAWGDHYDIFQYTSSGRITGYDGALDLDLYIGTKEGWDKWCKNSTVKSAATKVTTKTSKTSTATPKWKKMVNKAKQIAKDDSHGYSQYRRWPSQGSDFDCSSMMYYCADYAGYKIKMTDPRWTGSMLMDFGNAGFKTLHYKESILKEGDVLLSHNDSRQHTELYVGNGMTAGAHIASNGGIDDGMPGDQTGNEISIAPLSWTPQWILRPPDSWQSAATTTAKKTTGTKYVVTADKLNVRDKASTVKGNVVGSVKRGTKLYLTNVKKNSAGNTWGKVASGTYKGRYVAIIFHGETYMAKAKNVETLAKEVIAGKWGNGQNRIDALRKAGYDPAAVQAKVNELL